MSRDADGYDLRHLRRALDGLKVLRDRYAIPEDELRPVVAAIHEAAVERVALAKLVPGRLVVTKGRSDP